MARPKIGTRRRNVIFLLCAFCITRLHLIGTFSSPRNANGDFLIAIAQTNVPLTAAKALQMPPQNFRIVKGADQLVTSSSTVVTGYFYTASKHSSDEYTRWMTNMLSTLDPVVVFTETILVDKILSLRQHALNATVIIETTLQDLPISKIRSERFNSSQLFWQNELDIDPEKRIHKSYQLFWIWLSKSWWVMTAIQYNFFSSNFYMYADIGCYRNGRYNGKRIVQHETVVPEGATLWAAHQTVRQPPTQLWHEKLRAGQFFYHSGSQGAGTAVAWKNYHRVFSETIDAFIERKWFIGEDQMLLQSACQVAPTLCAYAPGNRIGDNNYFAVRHVLHYGTDVELIRLNATADK
ncbi:hypothetical protein MPSEU_000160800 [Mayamaea pseudoterrestris]|nr:hypothetical protein MPSEU_000160800 [Mayamaea pseudoterrestris]